MRRRLLRSLREYKKHALLSPLLSGLESSLDIIVPTFMAYLIDYGIGRQDMNAVLKYGLLLVLSAVTSMALGFLAGKSTAIASAGFARNLRNDIFRTTQTFSFGNIDKFSTSSLITRLTTDVSNVQHAFQMTTRIGARSPVMLVFALYFSFRTSVRLSLVFLGTTVILGLGLYLSIRHVYPVFVRVFTRYDKMNRIVQENLFAIRVVKNYTRESHEKRNFAVVSKLIYEDFTTAGIRIARISPLMNFCVFLSTTLIAWFGANEIVASGNNPALGLTTGQLTSLVTYTMQILVSLMMLSTIFIFFLVSRASVERIVEVLDETSDLHNGPDPVYEVPDGSIIFEDVKFTYSAEAEKPVLCDINLSIPSGAKVGILGGTGSSKSTLIQLIPRLYDVVEGRVLVGGIDVRDYDLASLRDQVSIVLQRNQLFTGSVKDNLRWGDESATDEEMIRACQLAQADDFVQAMPDGYDSHVERGGANLSGGQRQRLCIARSLLKNPKILIFDDSTSAVDTKTDRLIREGLRDGIPDTTILIISQRVASVRDADMIIVMDDGRVHDCGKHEELLDRSEIYREVYESQNRGGVLNAS